MNYITNEDGDIKVMFKGGHKFLPKHLAENKNIQKSQGFEIIEAPAKFKSEPDLAEAEAENIDDIGVPPFEEETKDEKNEEAKPVPAKRGRKPNK